MPRLISNQTNLPLTRNQAIMAQVGAYAISLLGGAFVMIPVVREYQKSF